MEASTDMRTNLHRMWATVAPAWGENADYADKRGAAVTERMLDLSGPMRGDRVLELACGAGGLGLAVAARVGPSGAVVLSDVAPEMTEIAGARAAALGIENVSTAVLDLEEIDEPDEAFDVALCREGLMFALDPSRAAGEIRRVLRPGGRFAVAVWGPRAANPWLAIVLDVISEQLGHEVPPPGVPGPFALDDSERLGALLTEAGFSDVSVDELPVPLRTGSFDEWWARTTALAGPVAKLLASLPEDASESIRARALEAVRPYETRDGLEFPGVTLLASGRQASGS